MKIGIGIGEMGGSAVPLDELIGQAQRAERDGFASVWLNQLFGIDALVAAALVGRETSRVEIGTSVVPTFSRHPVVMAQQALTAQAASHGRFALGIGLSHQLVIESMLGLSYAKPFTHMKEYVATLAPLIRTGSVGYHGSEFRVHASVAVPQATPCSILLAALAPRMLALAGAEADGTVTWMTGPKTLQNHTVPRISEAAARAGRPRPRVIAGLPIGITNDRAAAHASAARIFKIYATLPSYRAMLEREGAAGPEDIAVIGDEDSVRTQLEHLASIGVTDLLAVPLRISQDPDAVPRTRAFLARMAQPTGS